MGLWHDAPCEICGLDEGQDHTPCFEVRDLRAKISQIQELLTIRDRKIELQAKEIELLKKLLALQMTVKECPPWVAEPPVDRADLETDEYTPLMENKDA
jgi:hypothetical protein